MPEIAMIFNELSLRRPALNRHVARQWMSALVQLMREANAHELNAVRSHADFCRLMLSPEYTVAEWINDGEVDLSQREYLLSYATRYPFITPYMKDIHVEDPLHERDQNLIGEFEGEDALGLTYAYLLDGMAISFQSESCWDSHELTITRTEYLPETKSYAEDAPTVRHAGRPEQVVTHSNWIKERLTRRNVQNKDHLLQQWLAWFPKLILCENARRQLAAYNGSKKKLQQIVDRLQELQTTAAGWSAGNFPYIRSSSPESKVTLEQYGRDREFTCPDGETRTFSFHLKQLPDGWRIYYFPLAETRTVLIGYIEPHLPTASES